MNTLLTGASRGLGRALAHLLATKGHRLTLVARDECELDRLAGELSGSAHRVWPADLSRTETLMRLLERLHGEPFDLLINNAGAARFGPLAELSVKAAEEMVCLNFTAPLFLCREFLRQCRPGGMLVNVTSIVGTLPMPGNAVYSAAKAASSALSECLYFEALAKRVRVLDYRAVTLQTGFHKAAGGESARGGGKGVSAELAAHDLVRAIERGRSFVYAPGLAARTVALANRLLPRKLLLRAMYDRSLRAGYLPPTA
jgi:uncharacterized protein